MSMEKKGRGNWVRSLIYVQVLNYKNSKTTDAFNNRNNGSQAHANINNTDVPPTYDRYMKNQPLASYHDAPLLAPSPHHTVTAPRPPCVPCAEDSDDEDTDNEDSDCEGTDDEDSDSEESDTEAKKYVHVGLQRLNERKIITIIEGIKKNHKEILEDLMEECCCNDGCVVMDPEFGKVIKLLGYQRRNVSVFLVREHIVKGKHLKIHGF